MTVDTAMLNGRDAVCGGEAESVALTVKVNVPNAVADPLKQPYWLIVMPFGSDPELMPNV